MTRRLPFWSTFLALGVLALTHSVDAGEKGKLAFVRGGNIWIAYSDGTGARQLTHSGQDREPALSPDGGKVAFTSLGGKGTIFLISTAGGPVESLRLQRMDGAMDPSFSADGKRLVFVGQSQLRVVKEGRDEFGYATMSVSVVDLPTKQVRHVISNPDTLLDMGVIYANPSFSPDGRLIAVQDSGSDVSGGFWVMDRQGKTVFEFLPNPKESSIPYWRPRFSPDGKEILCYSPAVREGEKDNIYLVNMATKEKRKIAEGWNPTFVDGGKALVYEVIPNRWQAGGKKARYDLWRLDLTPGAVPRKILTDASAPSGY